MSIFTFNRGAWTDGSPLPKWADNEDHHDYLRRIGYNSRTATYGHEHGGHIEIYEADDANTFHAIVTPGGGSCFEVFLPDFPSLMMFIRDHAAAFASESSNGSTQGILTLLEKLFQLQHGHSAHSVCKQCDPQGWAAIQRVKDKETTR